MKKLIAIAATIITLSLNAYASDQFIKLNTHGAVLTKAERNTGQGWDTTTGSILIEIQGQVYAIEDSKYNTIKDLNINDRVIVCFCLNEDDRVAKLYIVEKL